MLKNALIERGLDSVFRADIDGVEVFLLEKWGKATKANIDAHVEALRLHGDEYDRKNLKLSAKFILNSLDNEMLRRTEHELGNNTANETTGPDVYAAVIALHSVLNDSTERFYIAKLSAFKLVKEPGQNVSTFSDNVLSVARHIDGISEHAVNDLHTLIYECYKGCSTEEFAAAVSNLLMRGFQNDPTVRDWETNVTMRALASLLQRRTRAPNTSGVRPARNGTLVPKRTILLNTSRDVQQLPMVQRTLP
jgi:hypothetical protein